MNDNTAAVQDFLNQYNDLCERTGFQLILNPVFVPTNHGSFEIGTQYAVTLLRKKEEPVHPSRTPQAQTAAVKPEVAPASPAEGTPAEPQFDAAQQPPAMDVEPVVQ